jgi:hypothetical protein
MSLATLKPSNLVGFAVMACALVALMLVFQLSHVEMASDTPASAQRSHSDTGGQTASPNPSNSGPKQEEQVRQLLAKQYEQRFGDSDKAIRAALNLKGEAAGFVGYNAHQNHWLIAESKGTDLEKAFTQLTNTTRGLLNQYPRAHIELRIYVKAEHLTTLRDGGNFGGYYMNAQGYLGIFDELQKWEYDTVEGIKILLQSAP